MGFGTANLSFTVPTPTLEVYTNHSTLDFTVPAPEIVISSRKAMDLSITVPVPVLTIDRGGSDIYITVPTPEISIDILRVKKMDMALTVAKPALEIKMRRSLNLEITVPTPKLSYVMGRKKFFDLAIEVPTPQLSISLFNELRQLFSVWSVNPTTGAHANYTSFPYTSLSEFQGNLYGTRAGGIDLLSGDDDNGTAIDAALTWAGNDFGTGDKKRLRMATVKLRYQGGDINVTALVDEVDKRVYPVSVPTTTGLNSVNVRSFARTQYGDTWQLGLMNQDGSDFEVLEIEVHPLRVN